MSMGQSYVMFMSCDIIDIIDEGGVGLRSRGGSLEVDQFGNLNNPSHFN